MMELLLNDCMHPRSNNPYNLPSVKITLSQKEWHDISLESSHPIYDQATRWPLLCSCALLTSRGELEWNEKYTSSGDMTHIGVFPRMMCSTIVAYCNRVRNKVDRYEDKERVKIGCKELKATHEKRLKDLRGKRPSLYRDQSQHNWRDIMMNSRPWKEEPMKRIGSDVQPSPQLLLRATHHNLLSGVVPSRHIDTSLGIDLPLSAVKGKNASFSTITSKLPAKELDQQGRNVQLAQALNLH